MSQQKFSGSIAAKGAIENGGIPSAAAAVFIWGLNAAGVDVPGEIAVAIAGLFTGLYRFGKACWKHWGAF